MSCTALSAPFMQTLGKYGKAQARDQFGTIVESLSTSDGIVEVTDYGRVAAVMMSYKQYLLLLAQANEPVRPRIKLAGSARLVGDLDTASRDISNSVLDSLNKSANDL